VGHLGCINSLPVVNNAAINMGVQVPFLWLDLYSFGYIPRSGYTYSSSTFSFFEEPPYFFPKWLY
jgi:hypothetical protein